MKVRRVAVMQGDVRSAKCRKERVFLADVVGRIGRFATTQACMQTQQRNLYRICKHILQMTDPCMYDWKLSNDMGILTMGRLFAPSKDRNLQPKITLPNGQVKSLVRVCIRTSMRACEYDVHVGERCCARMRPYSPLNAFIRSL